MNEGCEFLSGPPFAILEEEKKNPIKIDVGMTLLGSSYYNCYKMIYSPNATRNKLSENNSV